jgi:ribonuclease HI
LYFDGAVPNNQDGPQPAGLGAVLLHTPSGVVIAHAYERPQGRYSNNEAEYRSLLLGIRTARQLLPHFSSVHLSVFGDSMLVINQVPGIWKVRKPHLQVLVDQVRADLRDFAGGVDGVTFTHLNRTLNTAADSLANMALAADRSGEAWGLRPESWTWAAEGPRFGVPPPVPVCPAPLGPVPPRSVVPPSMLAAALGTARASPLDIRFNDPAAFYAGCLHDRMPQWHGVLDESASARQVGMWLRDRVDVRALWQNRVIPSRTFQGAFYPSATPPSINLPNHPVCYTPEFHPFVKRSVATLVCTGAARCLGPSSDPSIRPFLVMPLGVEEGKPRMFYDCVYFNCWFDGQPFTSEGVCDVCPILSPEDLQASLDAAQAYHHIGLTADSQQFFGFEFEGSWYVFTCLAFGWCLSPFIFHSVMAQPVACLRRSFGIAVLMYLDDIWLRGSRLQADPWLGGLATVYVAGQLFSALGFFIHVEKKSELWPAPSLRFLGLMVEHGRFTVPPHRTDSIVEMASRFLAAGEALGYELESFLGKVLSTYLAFPPASFYTRAMQDTLRAHPARRFRHVMVAALAAEVGFWAVFAPGASAPWLSASHVTVVVSADTLTAPTGAPVTFTVESPWARAEFREPGLEWPLSVVPSVPRSWIILAVVLNYLLVLAPTPPRSCHVDVVLPQRANCAAALSDPAFLAFMVSSIMPTFLVRLQEANLRVRVVRIQRFPSYGLTSRESDGSDYSLADVFLCLLQNIWGPFSAEAFASPLNARLPLFYSWFPAPPGVPAPAGVNALSQSYRGVVFANPPFLLLACWIQFCEEHGVTCVLIVPQWDTGLTSTSWWPYLWMSSYPRVLVAPSGTPGVFTQPVGRNPRERRPSGPWTSNVWAFRIDPRFRRRPPS